MKDTFTRLNILLVCLLGTVGTVFGQYEDIPGMSCENPIAVTEDFHIDIPIAGSFWFTAYTYDLPLHARYTVRGEYLEQKVVAYVDFRCPNGTYSDKKLEYIVTDVANGWGVEVPMKFDFQATYNAAENVTYYDVVIEDSYRELLAQFGISYNVKAYVNIITERYGSADLVPDDSFRSCIERSHWVSRPDSIVISQNTLDSIFTLPFSNWQNDSVRIRWTGTKYDVAVWLGEGCDFPLDQYDMNVIDYFRLRPNSYKDFSAADIQQMITLNGKGGIYYARMLTTDSAAIIIEPKPVEGPLAEAIEMEKDQSYDIAEASQYYYFRKTWENEPLQFAATGSDPITAHFGTTPDFTVSEDDANYLGKRMFEPTPEGQTLDLSIPELQTYTKEGEYLFTFVRFDISTPTTITPQTWATSACVGNTVLLPTETTLGMRKQSYVPTYRLRHADWSKQDMDFCLDGVSYTYLFIGDTCTFNATSSNKHVLFYKRFNGRDTLTITRDTLMSMEKYVDEDGYLYLQFMQNQTTGIMHIFPHPTEGSPTTGIRTANTERTFSVVQDGEQWQIISPVSQTFRLYNSVGALVSTWHQAAGTIFGLQAPAAGIYILRGDKDAILIRK